MPRFTINDRVETPRNGCGIVKTVWPKGKNAPAHYAVQVDNLKDAVVCEEGELRAAPPILNGDAVRCRDCARGKTSAYIPGSTRCAKFKQLRSAHSLRVCSFYRPRT